METMEGDGEFDIKPKYSIKIRGSVYESCVKSVMLYGAETWTLTGKLEDILQSCDSRMLR